MSGCATIAATSAGPVPVVSVGLPARQTFLAQLVCFDGPACTDALTVPAGKLLVIETYSADCGTAATTTAVRASLSMPQSGGLPYEFFFPLQPSFFGPIGVFGGPGRHHAITSAVRVYAGPGTEVSFNFQINPAGPTLFCQASISGMLVDCGGPGPVCSAP